MFEENEKLRQELIQTKMLLEQQQNLQIKPIQNQSLTNLNTNEQNNNNENQKLKNEIILLKKQLVNISNKDFLIYNDQTIHQKRIQDLERQVKELGIRNNISIHYISRLVRQLSGRTQSSIRNISDRMLNKKISVCTYL